MINGPRHKLEIEAFLFVVIVMCVFSGIVFLLPESVGTPQGQKNLRIIMGVLSLFCAPALMWVQKLVNHRRGE